MGENTVTMHALVTTCKICGNRDWRHYIVLHVGTCCKDCLPIAQMKSERATINSFAEMMQTMTFDQPQKLSALRRFGQWLWPKARR